MGKKSPCDSPRLEWFEDDFVARWDANGSATVAAATASVTVTVADGTKFTVGDLFAIPNAASSSTNPELCRVTARSSNVLTVTRAFAGTTVAVINPSVALAILGTAFEEGAAVATAKTTAPALKTSYTEIFKKSINLTNTMIASKVYGGPGGDRKRLHAKLLKQMKVDMNRSFLFGKASETLTGPGGNALRTTMGLNTAITTNVSSGGGSLTLKLLEAFARQSFRYGSQEKILLASPMVVSAVSYWANTKQFIRTQEKIFGVQVSKINTGHGMWYLVRDWMLENGGASGTNGFGGWAFSLDIAEIEMYTLNGNGQDRDLRLVENAVNDGADRV
ncbi:MAG: hypothetical protein GWP08_21460, partial [Nitrospiraceae bacterium]|nr:hypothetical protein [Nitrospiraceae bacterium]